MTSQHRPLRHLLATLAFRTQLALRDAPPGFGHFRAGPGVRTPQEIVLHMAHLVSHVSAALRGERGPDLEVGEDLASEVERFHSLLGELSETLRTKQLGEDLTDRILQGPVSDALTHVGQLAMLRRLAGSPLAGFDFFRAPIERDNVSAAQALP